MVSKEEKAQARKRSGSGARGKPDTGGDSDQQGGGKKASRVTRARDVANPVVVRREPRAAKIRIRLTVAPAILGV